MNAVFIGVFKQLSDENRCIVENWDAEKVWAIHGENQCSAGILNNKVLFWTFENI